MKINAETKYCQTCGIPLDIDYTNLEASQNVEYCDYCLHNGVKLYDFSMDYLIYLWGLFPEEYYKETGVNLTSEELRAEMSKRLPNIKRWKQKINTAHVQYDLIIRVQEYINRHLFDDLDTDKLSHVAGISKYYFRRLFKAVCGENIGIYIQRLRLEYIAFKLITTDVSVPKLLDQINYQNKHTFSRAFKSYFNCSIPEFRKKHSNVNPERKNPIRIEPSIEKVPGIRIAYLKLERTYNYEMFNRNYINLSNFYDEELNEKNDKKIDGYIVGSDQVWNPEFNMLRGIDLLNFTSNEKKFSYAASFGISQLPEYSKDMFKAQLRLFKKLSVREKAGKLIINKLMNREDVIVHPDPTLLIKKEGLFLFFVFS